MKYALIGDIHSSKEDLEKVLRQIKLEEPKAKIIGTGDLFECTISKKKITDEKFKALQEVMLNPEGFKELLTFPSVFGNQEERILHITALADPLRTWMKGLAETISIGNAEVIHGHQWKWGGEPWSLLKAHADKQITFFGHSHLSGLSIDGHWREITFDRPYDVCYGKVLVNVGAVVKAREWVLYDAEEQTVIFKKA